MHESLSEDKITKESATVSAIMNCVKKAILLVGDTSAQLSAKRREQVLAKLNPYLVSLGKEDFPGAGRELFGEGFKSRLKLRTETANTVAQAEKAGAPVPGWQSTASPKFLQPNAWQSDQLQQLLRSRKHPKVQLSPPVSAQTVMTQRPNHLLTGMLYNLLSFSNNPIAGRLKFFLPAWLQITRDPWVLQVAQGYQIQFICNPVQEHLPVIGYTSQEDQLLIDQEVQELLAKQAVHYVPSRRQNEQGFISSLFAVPKKGGGHRPAINLRPLNNFIPYKHFKMESIYMLKVF